MEVCWLSDLRQLWLKEKGGCKTQLWLAFSCTMHEHEHEHAVHAACSSVGAPCAMLCTVAHTAPAVVNAAAPPTHCQRSAGAFERFSVQALTVLALDPGCCCSSMDGSGELIQASWSLTSCGLRLEATLNGRQYEGELQPIVLPRGWVLQGSLVLCSHARAEGLRVSAGSRM